jgi:hypothetical protein
VASRIVLTVTPEGGPPQQMTTQLQRGEFNADFAVEVPTGRVRFQVEVANNDGLLLFSGDTTQAIQSDQFQVVMNLLPRTPFLVVRPDSVARDSSTTSLGLVATTLAVLNRGADTLRWSLDNVVGSTAGTAPLEFCADAPAQPCLRVSSFAGSLLPGDSTRISLRGTSAQQEAYRLLFGSNVGGVEVNLVVPGAYSGRGSATLDGRITTQEWAGAAAIGIPIRLPGGQTSAGTLRVMNDDDFLYLSLAFPRDSVAWATDSYLLSLDFDNDADGTAADGDDGFDAAVFEPSPTDTLARPVLDNFRASPPDCPSGPSCRLSDSGHDRSNEGQYAVRNDGRSTMIEMAKPLRSGDLLVDFFLQPTQMVGFQLLTSFQTAGAPVTTLWPAPDVWAVFRVRGAVPAPAVSPWTTKVVAP